jgi:hypothetical protein
MTVFYQKTFFKTLLWIRIQQDPGSGSGLSKIYAFKEISCTHLPSELFR